MLLCRRSFDFAKIDAGVNFMLASDQIEIVLEREDIGSTLKRGVAAIAERPVTPPQ